MTKIDEVSETLGNLDAKTDLMIKKIDGIETHLKELNGTVSKHQQKMGSCEVRFGELEKAVGSTKWDYKFWAAITGLMAVIAVLMHSLGF